MPSTKEKSRKERKLAKLIEGSDSSDESEHELSHYVNDRVKLMKEVLKIIKPKKIKTMAPTCMKDLDLQEINSMLLEELLGISNKRLKYIFNGQSLDEDSSSSTDPEEEKPIDIISLDDISDDDFVIDLDSSSESSKKKNKKIKKEPTDKKIKKERDKSKKKHKIADKTTLDTPEKSQEQNLMSVLELLELQARARAIRSQLILEAQKKAEKQVETIVKHENSDNEDAVIIESPKLDEIVITSSGSEDEGDNNDVDLSKNISENKSDTNNEPITENVESNVEIPMEQNNETETNNSPSTNEPSNEVNLNDIELPKDKSDENSKQCEATNLSRDSPVNSETTSIKTVEIDNNPETASSNTSDIKINPKTIKKSKHVHKDKVCKKKTKHLEENSQSHNKETTERSQFDGDAGIIINIDDDDIEEINNSN